MAVQLFEDIQYDLNRVLEVMVQELQSDQSYLNQIISYLLQKRGKMIRPALVILSGKICKSNNEENLYALGAAVEMLHMATLVHDDIVDDAEVRRNLATVNKLYNNQIAVLVGDFFYARSLRIFSRVQQGFDLISRVVSNLVQGEFLQQANTFKLEQEPQVYWNLINYKTAYFIANCCRLGAMEGGGSKAQVEALTAYGQKLGLAFQVCDDLLDFSLTPDKVGKTSYKDVSNGIYTLPILHALRKGNDQENLRKLLQKDQLTGEDQHTLLEILRKSGSLDYAHQQALELTEDARRELAIFPDCQEKETLQSLARFNIKREY